MIQRHILFASLAIMLMLVSTVDISLAQGIGADASAGGDKILATLENAITGNIGFFIGLAITILGLWTWIVKQETGAGITMIIGGVLITLVPGIFNGMREVVGGVVNQFSAGQVNSVR